MIDFMFDPLTVGALYKMCLWAWMTLILLQLWRFPDMGGTI